jgi:pilus assembly protein CpaE
MSSEKPLHESDFESDFEDVFADDPLADLALPKEEPMAEEMEESSVMVDLDTPQREVEFDQPVFSAPEDGLGGDSVLPAISIQVFYERDETRLLMEVCARDRRMGRATIEAQAGGISAATEYMRLNPTPNLLIIESSARSAQLLSEIDQLAEHCDETVKVMVVGAINDIALYRQLVARGVSEYVVPPFQPLQILRTISGLFADPDAPFVGKQISVVGAKGGVGASTLPTTWLGPWLRTPRSIRHSSI